MVDDTLTWKSYIEMITPKLSAACFAVTAIKPFVMLDTSKMVYHSYFLYVINYRIIFGEIPHVVIVFSNYTRELLELSWV